MNRYPHVVIDARMAGAGGIGTYIRSLLPHVVRLRPEWQFTLLVPPTYGWAGTWDDTANVQTRPLRSSVYSVAEQIELKTMSPRRCDLFWSPHYNIPLIKPARLLVTVHDVIHIVRPEYRTSALKHTYARLMFAAVRRRADAILFDSAFTRREFERWVGAPARMHEIVHLGVDEQWRHPIERPERRRPYVLYVGYLKPHKNLLALVRAFAMIAADVPHDLVIVGRSEGLRTADREVAREAMALGERVVFTGETNFTELRRWMHGADLLAQPSLYEGFGLPPLEAMAAGCPCVVAHAGSLPEVCGDAVLYCNPHEPSDIADKIRHALCDGALRESMRRRGRSHAARFTWARCADQTISAMERIL